MPSDDVRIILIGDCPLDLKTFKLPSSCEIPRDIITPNKQAPSRKPDALCGIEMKTNFNAEKNV